jgi:cell wall-associated NlpC family hydrolase
MFDNAPISSSRTLGSPTSFPVQGADDIVRRVASRLAAILVIVATLLLATGTSVALAAPSGFDTGRSARTAKATSPWSWSVSSRNWTRSSRVLPAGLVRRGPRAPINRGQFLSALLRVQALRGEPRQRLMRSRRSAPALRDARAGSAAARAVARGWFPARNGRFDAKAAITTDEAALAITSALGLRGSVSQLAVKLRSELPGTRMHFTYAAANALARTLGLRYNVKDPDDELELGPGEALNVAHGSYMLQAAATQASGWKYDDAVDLAATFELPDLGPNQLLVLGTAARMLGQPYVWAGETEGDQAEGHGGFDCSGFAIRVVNEAGVPVDQLDRVLERTTYTQSALPASRRIGQDQLQPGDVMFFGDRGPSSSPSQNFHAGVYMGNGWFIHSSGGNGGVAINALDGWWGEHFSWGRRALRTA